MKQSLIVVGMLAVGFGAKADGLFNVFNVGQPIFDVDHTTTLSKAKGRFEVLFGSCIVSLPNDGSGTPFAGNGIIYSRDYTNAYAIPGANIGDTPTVTIRVWDVTTGATFSTAAHKGSTRFVLDPLGGDRIPPGGTSNFHSFALGTSAADFFTYEWNFNGGNLSPAIGSGTMTYADKATFSLTKFGTTDNNTVPDIDGHEVAYMHLPSFIGTDNGYLLTFNDSTANGGGKYINQYTFIADVLVPPPLNWVPLFNTNPKNQNDADFYIDPSGAIGIYPIYSPPATVRSGTWIRLAFVADLIDPLVNIRLYANGKKVAQGKLNSPLDGRWSIFPGLTFGGGLLLFNEGDTSGVYTHELYVSHIAFVDQNLGDFEIAELGGPAWDGIFLQGNVFLPRLNISTIQNSITITWPCSGNFVLQKTFNLPANEWKSIDGTYGRSSYTEPLSIVSTFYRLKSQ